MGWGELLLVGVVALIVVGPKDLPVMFHSLGRMSAKARRMAREFQNAMSDAAEASGASEITQEMKNLSSNNLGMGNSMTKAADAFDKWDPLDESKGRKVGPETAKLSKERAEAADKIRARTAQKEQEKREVAAKDAPASAPKKTAEKKAATKKPAAKKPAAKKPVAKKAAPKKAAPKKAAPKKTDP